MERVLVLGVALLFGSAPVDDDPVVGTLPGARRVNRLEITRPGVYENYLIDAEGREETAVTIRADNVTLRHCEIRNGRGEGIDVLAKNAVIEYVRIHHMLAGTYKKPADAHGISGAPDGLKIRHCEIYYCSGDGIQFDPGRGRWDDVLVEHCRIWTGPLPLDALGYRKGQRPGENAIDTKTPADQAARMTIRSSVFRGFRQPAQMENVSALNLKENVRVRIEDCAFEDNEFSVRARGPSAVLELRACTFERTAAALRVEDDPRVTVQDLTYGDGVLRPIEYAGKNKSRVVEK
jgi:hypothetical protein